MWGGEFGRLVMEANGFAAVTSTGGAGTFRAEWAKEIEPISEVYICFDRDPAGRRGAVRVGLMIPQAKLVELPEEVGLGGDVTDYFVGLKRSREDFIQFLERAQPVPTELRIENFRSLLATPRIDRSEEHTSELQSHLNLVCRLLLEKKKKHISRSIQALLRSPFAGHTSEATLPRAGSRHSTAPRKS